MTSLFDEFFNNILEALGGHFWTLCWTSKRVILASTWDTFLTFAGPKGHFGILLGHLFRHLAGVSVCLFCVVRVSLQSCPVDSSELFGVGLVPVDSS